MKKELIRMRKRIEKAEAEKEEGKFQFCGYDEEEINIPAKRAYRPKKAAAVVMLVLALTAGLLGVPDTSITETNPYTVEAKSKKDKKKPVIRFSGKTKITVEKGKSVKIPKTTAKDNKDGNVTKKITVTVKKGKKKYSSIAKAVKKNKKVKFTSTGTYKITYTVKDKAGNKATKTRTIKVVAPKKKTTPQIPTTERVTTEVPTTQRPTTQTPTTEKVTTEQPTTETLIAKEADLSKYGKITKINVDGVEYKLLTEPNDEYIKIRYDNPNPEPVCRFEFGKWDMSSFAYDAATFDYLEGHKYLSFWGKISIIDDYGVDCSNNIFITEEKISNSNQLIVVSFVDSKGNAYSIKGVDLYNNYSTVVNSDLFIWAYIDEEAKICISGCQSYDNTISLTRKE